MDEEEERTAHGPIVDREMPPHHVRLQTLFEEDISLVVTSPSRTGGNLASGPLAPPNHAQGGGFRRQSRCEHQASVVNLANNRLGGSIPASLGLMSGNKIRGILLLNNQLTGCIPEGIELFSGMQVFDVSYNSLTGHLPDTVSCLNQIEVLNLGHNKLSGVLPDVVCSLKSLVNLTVAYNFFSGFSQECTTLPFQNVGFDFAVNCILNRQMQRPQTSTCAFHGEDKDMK